MNGFELQSSIVLIFTVDVSAPKKPANHILAVLHLLWFRDGRNEPAVISVCVM